MVPLLQPLDLHLPHLLKSLHTVRVCCICNIPLGGPDPLLVRLAFLLLPFSFLPCAAAAASGTECAWPQRRFPPAQPASLA